MIEFTVYDKDSGRIIASGVSPTPMLAASESRGVLEGVALDDTQFRLDPETLEPIPLQPLVNQDQLRIEINRERDRRIEVGRVISGIHVTGRDRDQLILLALKDTARDLKAAGITDAIIPFRDGQDVEHMLTADKIINLADAGKAYVTAVYQASWALKAMDPIPQDVTDDQYWPVVDW